MTVAAVVVVVVDVVDVIMGSVLWCILVEESSDVVVRSAMEMTWEMLPRSFLS
jgi:hypothetical protein